MCVVSSCSGVEARGTLCKLMCCNPLCVCFSADLGFGIVVVGVVDFTVVVVGLVVVGLAVVVLVVGRIVEVVGTIVGRLGIVKLQFSSKPLSQKLCVL